MQDDEGCAPLVDIDTERWLNGEDISGDDDNPYIAHHHPLEDLDLELCDCEDYNPDECAICEAIDANAVAMFGPPKR